jgi:hypothetical protein
MAPMVVWNVESIEKLNDILQRQPLPRNADIAAEMGCTKSALQTAMSRFNLSPHAHRENVKHWRDQKPHATPNRRPVRLCMCCEKPFGSEGIEDRLCPPCGGIGSNGEDDYA